MAAEHLHVTIQTIREMMHLKEHFKEVTLVNKN